jgi:hypothetical protein
MSQPLDSLHDFYQPPPPSFWPQTIGWYIVFAIASLLLLWFVVHQVRGWRKNRYRREALNELAHIEVTELSALLKRTALSAWPREEVAVLSGPAWLKFLDGSTPKPLFENAPANRIEEITFTPMELSREAQSSLRNASAAWIKQHKPPRRPRGPHVSA